MKILGIKKSAEFQNIGKKGKKFHAKTVLVITLPTPQFYFCNKQLGKNALDFMRVGFTVSKTVGNAVTRNFAKRRLREAAKMVLLKHAKNHHDFVIIAKREIAKASYDEILKDLNFTLKNLTRNC